MEIRWAKPQDREALSDLWHICFGDDIAFRRWFFENRFWPEYCIVACQNGLPIGAVYGLPVRLRIRKHSLPAVIIGGVSTHPDHRGQGVMHRLFTAFQQELHRRTIPLTFLHPVRQDLYYSLGHYTSCDRGFLTRPANAPLPGPQPGVVTVDPDQCITELLDCYRAYIRPYSGPTDRDMAHFALKCADYRTGGAQCAAVRNSDGLLTGYCFFFAEEKALLGEECVALTDEAYLQLAAHLAHLAGSRELTVKLPADHLPQLPGAQTEIKPWGCMGAAHLPSLLRQLGQEHTGFSIQVTDPVVPANNGIFDLNGQRTCRPPQLTTEAGHLTQWLAGYRSLAQLADENAARIHDHAAATELDRLLPVQNCLCSDEY